MVFKKGALIIAGVFILGQALAFADSAQPADSSPAMNQQKIGSSSLAPPRAQAEVTFRSALERPGKNAVNVSVNSASSSSPTIPQDTTDAPLPLPESNGGMLVLTGLLGCLLANKISRPQNHPPALRTPR